jgi:hypothetical protein
MDNEQKPQALVMGQNQDASLRIRGNLSHEIQHHDRIQNERCDNEQLDS